MCIGLIYGMYVGVLGEDAELPGAGDCLGPVGDVQLAIDTGRVGFDGARGHNELPGDLLVGPAQGHEMENFQLTLAQWLDQSLSRACRGSPAGEAFSCAAVTICGSASNWESKWMA